MVAVNFQWLELCAQVIDKGSSPRKSMMLFLITYSSPFFEQTVPLKGLSICATSSGKVMEACSYLGDRNSRDIFGMLNYKFLPRASLRENVELITSTFMVCIIYTHFPEPCYKYAFYFWRTSDIWAPFCTPSISRASPLLIPISSIPELPIKAAGSPSSTEPKVVTISSRMVLPT